MASVIATTLDGTLAAQARQCAHDLAQRLLAVDTADLSRGFGGHAGYALAWLSLYQDDPRDVYARRWHDAMRTSAAAAGTDVSVAYGISGLRAAAALSLAKEPRYQGLLEKCDAHINATLAHDITLRNFNDYDLIAGPAGALAALALAPAKPSDFMTHRLAALAGDDEALALRHPLQQGDPVHDLGTAHGIFGLCAAVAMHAAALDAAERQTLRNAMQQAADQAYALDGRATMRPWRESPPESAMQNAWCYGIPGAASAALTVGEALDDTQLQTWALDTLATLSETEPDRLSQNAGLCHGSAGIAVTLLRPAQRDRRLHALLAAHAEATIQRAQRGEFDTEFGGNDVYNGPPGVILALLTLAGRCSPDWLRLLAAALPA